MVAKLTPCGFCFLAYFSRLFTALQAVEFIKGHHNSQRLSALHHNQSVLLARGDSTDVRRKVPGHFRGRNDLISALNKCSHTFPFFTQNSNNQ
ncbi:hypothetical protein H2136_20365 [Aeromonas hydrophila]|uniref:Uncharacterized protein n=1 Tax=Aeromonas hydrophila TaxID=644 RepID=A0A926FKD4_AERHY|nr:hypothetical protein [Aeromonas hydrophila]